jgi:hypothetical protein
VTDPEQLSTKRAPARQRLWLWVLIALLIAAVLVYVIPRYIVIGDPGVHR